MKSLIFACLIIYVALATRGIDISQPGSASFFQCAKSNGYDFAIIRGYLSYGAIDPNAKTSLENAKNAGLYHDAYHFPCIGKVSATDQVNQIVNYLGSLPGIYWIDVENNPSSGCGWRDANYNCNFLQQLINAFKARGHTPGIYANWNNWQAIFGGRNNCEVGKQGLQIWYPHYDNSQSFSDFQAFGGWTHPNIKQYKGDTTLCGLGVDDNFY